MSSEINISNFSKKSMLISLNDPEKLEKWSKILGKLNASFTKSKDPSWILPNEKMDELEEILYTLKHKKTFKDKSSKENKESKSNEKDDVSVQESSDKDSSDESDEDESESDTDDELIQKVLARRLKSESSQKEIAEYSISDSDNEDVVTHSRRIRHLYKIITQLDERLKKLENLNIDK